MRLRWLSTVGAVLVLAGASCAQGFMFLGAGGSGAAGGAGPTGSTTHASASSSSGGPGGAGGAVSSSSSGVTVSSSSSSSSTSSGCPDSPCKVTSPQCGCPAGEQCTVTNFMVACGLMGTDAQSQPCGTTASDLCAPGLICVQTSPTVSTCSKFCAADTECTAPGGLCLLTLNDGMGGSIPNVKICTENCNPTNNSGCAAGTGCQLEQESMGQMRFLTQCTGVGTKTANQVCDPMLTECAATFGCFNTGVQDVCLQYCDVNGSSCPGAGFCSPLADANMNPITLGNITFGVCQ